MRTPVAPVLTLAVLGATLTACGDNSGSTGASPGASPGHVAPCVTGDWRGSGVEGRLGTGAAGGGFSGGGGVVLSVEPDGRASLDFSDMAPITFSGQVAGTDVRGEFSYAGNVHGSVGTDTDATSGAWTPGSVDWEDVRVTVNLTEPVAAQPLDDVPLGEYAQEASERFGDMIDINPVLGEGTYQCRDDTLILDSGDDGGVVWTLSRT